MRKMMIMAAVLGIGWAAQGCKKENPLSPSNELNAQSTKAPKVENGCLVFENNDQFSYYLEKTANMSYEERLDWENSIGFRSLSTIENQANDIEVERMDAFFAGQPDDLNGNDYVAMGLNYEPSEFYKEYVAKGVLVASFDDNGNRSTDISVKNRSFIHLINENGEVIVEGIKVKNEGNKTTIMDASKNIIIHEYEVFNSQPVDEKSLEQNYWLTKGIGPIAGQRDGWRNNNPNPSNADRRVRSWVYCHTSPFGLNEVYAIVDGRTTLVSARNRMNVNHYYHASAEQRRFGNWARRNSFKPIQAVNLQFEYEYMHVAQDLHIKRYKSQAPWLTPDVSGWNAFTSFGNNGAGFISAKVWQPTGMNTNVIDRTLRYNGMPWHSQTYLGGFTSAMRIYNPFNNAEFGGFYQTTFSSVFPVQTHQL